MREAAQCLCTIQYLISWSNQCTMAMFDATEVLMCWMVRNWVFTHDLSGDKTWPGHHAGRIWELLVLTGRVGRMKMFMTLFCLCQIRQAWRGKVPKRDGSQGCQYRSYLVCWWERFFLSGCMAQRCRCPGGRPSVSYKWWKCRNKRWMKIPPKQQLHQK